MTTSYASIHSSHKGTAEAKGAVRFEVCNGADVESRADVGVVCFVMHELPPQERR